MTRPVRSTRARIPVESDTDSDVIVIDSDSDDFRPSPPASASASPSFSAPSRSASPPSPSPSASASETEVRGTKRKRGRVGRGTNAKPKATNGKTKAMGTGNGNGKGEGKRNGDAEIGDIEDYRPHGREYHDTAAVVGCRDALLAWFENVRDERGMPWRKRYDAGLSMDEKGQRAYEVWVSEVMLQQTQVATVIAYFTRWLARWPTLTSLAAADIEDVNAAWKGLGYYRRAASLLAGARAVASSSKHAGRLPADPEELERDIPGVGRYTAGAIASIAYGVRAPIVDGNIHRVLTRLLGVHAPQTAPETLRFLWSTAEALVDALPRGLNRGIAGDWNQALMELGATVCRPVNPECGACPLKEGCRAYAELTTPPPPPTSDPCTLCHPIPAADAGPGPTIPSVTVFPMRKVKKESRVEHEVVCITEWRGREGERMFLFVKRPEKGLLAGLFEPPTTPIPLSATPSARLTAATSHLATFIDPASLDITTHAASTAVPHIFSHINMTYHVQHLVLTSDSDTPPVPAKRARWLTPAETTDATVGTGVKKCWAAVFGSWGVFEPAQAGARGTKRKGSVKSKPGSKAKAKAKVVKAEADAPEPDTDGNLPPRRSTARSKAKDTKPGKQLPLSAFLK